ncbi:hypothetical protein SO802_000194 [Lithocarpus litseifolius]|uniref:Disease resistance R13L4/SHOC-2-like LRR domain-containing protein n=1 Tax=Lithocarpus litseifolius TaxID=425828 RepID=A0AAW2DQY4_9ROSI
MVKCKHLEHLADYWFVLRIFALNKLRKWLSFEDLLFQKHLIIKEMLQRSTCFFCNLDQPNATVRSRVENLKVNTFKGHIPSALGNLIQLSFLHLTDNELTGPIPFELANLTQLTHIFLFHNFISGQIPFGLMNLTKLFVLDLAGDNLAGQIPSSIFNLVNLEFLDLSSNNFTGKVEFDKFDKLNKLTSLYISNCGVSLIINETSDNTTLQKFQNLGLGSCNLSKFPNFLTTQNELKSLDLGANNIHGQVPEWFWNVSKENLEVIDLSYDFLTSLGRHPILLPWTRLAIIDLNSDNLQGSLPIPPFSTPVRLQHHSSCLHS